MEIKREKKRLSFQRRCPPENGEMAKITSVHMLLSEINREEEGIDFHSYNLPSAKTR